MTMKTTNSHARIFLVLIAFAITSVGIARAQENAVAPEQEGKSPSPCNCKGWKGDSLRITSPTMSKMVKCGERVTVKKGTYYSLTSPTYICTPTGCMPTYHWSIVGPLTGTHVNKTYPFNFTSVGTYVVTITPWCGKRKCPPCTITVIVTI